MNGSTHLLRGAVSSRPLYRLRIDRSVVLRLRNRQYRGSVVIPRSRSGPKRSSGPFECRDPGGLGQARARPQSRDKSLDTGDGPVNWRFQTRLKGLLDQHVSGERFQDAIVHDWRGGDRGCGDTDGCCLGFARDTCRP